MMMDLTILLLWCKMIKSMQLIRSLQKDCSFDALYQYDDDDDDDNNDDEDDDNGDDDDDL